MCLPLIFQCTKRMRRIILPPVACLAVPNLYTLAHKRHDFGGGRINVFYITEHKMCAGFCLQLLSEIFLILRILDRDTINAHVCSCKIPVIVRF